jgi:hypothetical protein
MSGAVGTQVRVARAVFEWQSGPAVRGCRTVGLVWVVRQADLVIEAGLALAPGGTTAPPSFWEVEPVGSLPVPVVQWAGDDRRVVGDPLPTLTVGGLDCLPVAQEQVASHIMHRNQEKNETRALPSRNRRSFVLAQTYSNRT